MIAVADTSPICYLVWIGEYELLGHLFDQVIVPKAVIAELSHADAPPAVRSWTSKPPSWLSVAENPLDTNAELRHLQAGERFAILLAQVVGADLLLVDERGARTAAQGLGVPITGTLGLLGRASSLGLVDFASSIERLTGTSFRYSPALIRAALEQFGGPKKR